jgi:hypothetical protein
MGVLPVEDGEGEDFQRAPSEVVQMRSCERGGWSERIAVALPDAAKSVASPTTTVDPSLSTTSNPRTRHRTFTSE